MNDFLQPPSLAHHHPNYDAIRVQNFLVIDTPKNCCLPSCNFQIPDLIPIQIPPCNYVGCLRYFNQTYAQVPLSDHFKSMMEILFMPKAMIKKVLDKTLTNPRSVESGASCHDSYYLFNLTDTPYPPYNKNFWVTMDNRLTGQDLPSLVRVIRGGSDTDAIEFIAEIVGVDFTKTNVPQVNEWEGHSFVRHSHTYPSVHQPSIVTALLGPPKEKYCFNNANNRSSFFLFKWVMYNKPLHLFLTLQQNNHCRANVFEFIAPPADDRIYNNRLIKAYEGKKIHIHDDISNADDSNTSISIGTWAGDLSFALDLDWSCLTGRTVQYIFNQQNPDSFKIGAYLLQAFQKMRTKLELINYDKSKFRKSFINEDEFFQKAKDIHGLDLKPKVVEPEACCITLEQLSKMEIPTQDYVLNPAIKPGQFIILHGERKCSKSWLASDILACIGAGESMGTRFSAPSPSTVALVDAELMLDESKFRLQAIGDLYSNRPNLSKNFKLISLRGRDQGFDFLNECDQDWLIDQIKESKIVVLDNYGTLTRCYSEGAKPWREFLKGIRKITDLGIAVILVHHTNKQGQLRGTQKIADDADLVISLKRPEQWNKMDNIVELHFEAARHLHGKQLMPLSIKYYEENGVFKRDIQTIDSESGEPMAAILVADEEIENNNLNGLEIEMLTLARSGESGRIIKAADFKLEGTDNSSSISKSFGNLVNRGLLLYEGGGRGRRYYCPTRMQEDKS